MNLHAQVINKLLIVYFSLILWRQKYINDMKKKTMLDLHRITCEEFKEAEKIPLVVILDDVRSLNNIGSVFRTADAFRVEKIYLCGISATPPNVEIHKTALGAEDSVDWVYFENIVDAINDLRGKGYIICSIEQVEGSKDITKISINRANKYAIIMGNEVKGVNQVAVDASDCCIEIPQYGTKHSLNVSISAGIVIWDFFKALRKED